MSSGDPRGPFVHLESSTFRAQARATTEKAFSSSALEPACEHNYSISPRLCSTFMSMILKVHLLPLTSPRIWLVLSPPRDSNEPRRRVLPSGRFPIRVSSSLRCRELSFHRRGIRFASQLAFASPKENYSNRLIAWGAINAEESSA